MSQCGTKYAPVEDAERGYWNRVEEGRLKNADPGDVAAEEDDSEVFWHFRRDLSAAMANDPTQQSMLDRFLRKRRTGSVMRQQPPKIDAYATGPLMTSTAAGRPPLTGRFGDLEPFLSHADGDHQQIITVAAVDRAELDSIQHMRDAELQELQYLMQERHQKDMLAIDDLQGAAMMRVEEDHRRRLIHDQMREKRREQRHQRRLTNMRKAFQRARKQLGAVLDRREEEIRNTYGILRNASMMYGSASGDRTAVDWSKYRRTVEYKIELMRAVKNKLPGGEYMLIASIYERLGGAVLPWKNIVLPGSSVSSKLPRRPLLASCPLHEKYVANCEACTGLVGATVPVSHSGRFDAVELPFGQSLFTVAPSRRFMKPYMTVIFELVLLGDEKRGYGLNRVVAWGAFPLCDSRFDVVRGKYKVPLIRGPVNARLDNYEKIERHIREDLDRWVSNLYFEVIHMQRTAKGRKEHDLDRELTENLLALSSRDRELGKADVPEDERANNSDGDEDGHDDMSDASSSLVRSSNNKTVGFDLQSAGQWQSLPGGAGPSRLSVTKSRAGMVSSLQGRPVESEYAGGVGGQQSSGIPEAAHEDLYEVAPGLGFTVHHEDEAEVKEDQSQSLSSLLMTYNRRVQYKKQKETHAQKLERYQFAVQREEGFRAYRESGLKIHYMFRATISDMGITEWRTLEFWVSWLMMIMVFWCRLCSHYVGQYLFLKAAGFPIYEFEPDYITFHLGFDSLHVTVWYTIGVIIAGVLFNAFIFSLLGFVSWASQKMYGSFFYFGSQFIVFFGIGMVLDELLLLVVDAAIGNEAGDAFKLYHFYGENDKAGYLGVCLTVLLFIVLFLFTGFLLYHYILRIHNNGLMHDVWVRLHGPNYAFFVPHDLEVSLRELQYICEKAEAWRGPEGERRKIVVFDYITKDQEDSQFTSRTTHLAIFTLDVENGGERTVYRQFLRLPDGIVIELFGEIEAMGSEEYSTLQRTVLQPVADQASALEEFLQGVTVVRHDKTNAAYSLRTPSHRWQPAVHSRMNMTTIIDALEQSETTPLLHEGDESGADSSTQDELQH